MSLVREAAVCFRETKNHKHKRLSYQLFLSILTMCKQLCISTRKANVVVEKEEDRVGRRPPSMTMTLADREFQRTSFNRRLPRTSTTTFTQTTTTPFTLPPLSRLPHFFALIPVQLLSLTQHSFTCARTTDAASFCHLRPNLSSIYHRRLFVPLSRWLTCLIYLRG